MSEPDYLNGNVSYIRGSVLDDSALKQALEGVDVVFHEAALVGVGQSMYQIARYTEANVTGTAKLLQHVVDNGGVEKLVVASSMSIYGEGAYECEECGVVYPKSRSEEDLRKRDWEMKCSCGRTVRMLPTSEEKPLVPTSVYAISKKTQEELVMTAGRAYGIPSVALRYFNVYGPRQSLSNPYTGVAAIFSSRIKNGNPPEIFEDGGQTRDFISVKDIAAANILAMENSKANYEVFNVGTGRSVSIKEIADTLIKLYGKSVRPEVNGRYRTGDIRHCFADIAKISRIGFRPSVDIEAGMRELVDWGGKIHARDTFEDAKKEMERKGLIA
jgi:dTDP-L-rhamnose 4-epimerase